MKLYTQEEVDILLFEQRHNCQIERDKRSVHNESGWFVHCDDVYNAQAPEMPNGIMAEDIWNKACDTILADIQITLLSHDNLNKATDEHTKLVIKSIGEKILDFPKPNIQI